MSGGRVRVIKSINNSWKTVQEEREKHTYWGRTDRSYSEKGPSEGLEDRVGTESHRGETSIKGYATKSHLEKMTKTSTVIYPAKHGYWNDVTDRVYLRHSFTTNNNKSLKGGEGWVFDDSGYVQCEATKEKSEEWNGWNRNYSQVHRSRSRSQSSNPHGWLYHPIPSLTRPVTDDVLGVRRVPPLWTPEPGIWWRTVVSPGRSINMEPIPLLSLKGSKWRQTLRMRTQWIGRRT